jgi:hypothetical protein
MSDPTVSELSAELARAYLEAKSALTECEHYANGCPESLAENRAYSAFVEDCGGWADDMDTTILARLIVAYADALAAAEAAIEAVLMPCTNEAVPGEPCGECGECVLTRELRHATALAPPAGAEEVTE